MNCRIPLLGLLVILATVGCGSQRTVVEGKVTVAGKGPLTGGTIQFVLAADPKMIAAGQIRGDGNYEVIDAPVGECKVVVDNLHLKVGGSMPGMGPPGRPGMPGSGSAGPPRDSKQATGTPEGVPVDPEMGKTSASVGVKYVPIDPNNADPTTTTLKANVSGSSHPIDFEVQ